jgi:hypothetical protein
MVFIAIDKVVPKYGTATSLYLNTEIELAVAVSLGRSVQKVVGGQYKDGGITRPVKPIPVDEVK